MNGRGIAETLLITLAALATSLVLFGVFMLLSAGPPLAELLRQPLSGLAWTGRLYFEMFMGGFGAPSSWENTLTRAAPLILAALCTAVPARLGLIIIGGEGALVLGGLVAASVGLLLQAAPVPMVQLGMLLSGMLAGGLVIALVGILRDRRGVNETIASLLVTYIIIRVFNFLVEGPLRDPDSLNKPSTYPIPDAAMIGTIWGLDVHWGLAFGVLACLLVYVLVEHTTFGFAARMVGGNVRAAQAAGLPVGRLILIACLLGGAAAGLAGAMEIAAVHGQANASLIAGYGFTGILVSFIARHHPLAIIPSAILFGGLSASSSTLQGSLGLPDASVEVLRGIIFVLILLFETLYGRIRLFQPRLLLTSAVEERSQPAPRGETSEALVR